MSPANLKGMPTSTHPDELSDKPRYSPMLEQYFTLREQHPEAILLARVGDFYEAYGDDAETIARALSIALTAKDAGGGKRVAMAGVPHHAVDGYLARLVAQRFIVAIADQMEVPVANKLVRRAITRIVTPGTLVEERLLERSVNNYLCVVTGADGAIALAYADLSTGEVNVTAFDGDAAIDEAVAELHRVTPAEIVCDLAPAMRSAIADAAESVSARLAPLPRVDRREAMLFDGFTRDESILMSKALHILHAYVRRVGFIADQPLGGPRGYRRGGYLMLDTSTRRHLELTRAIGANAKATLLATLDKTHSAMGARLLLRWILAPLVDEREIARRSGSVGCLLENYGGRSALAERLDALFDLERIVQKVRFRRALPRDLVSLRRTLEALAPLRSEIAACLPELAASIDDFSELHQELAATLLDEPAATLADGGVIRPEADGGLAECVSLRQDGNVRLNQLEERERARTGIKTLKVKYASAFGYAIEVSKNQLSAVPAEWTRRQTLTNAERFVTPELKDLEAAIASAATRAVRLEETLFAALVERVALDVDALLRAAEAIAEVDVYVSFAQIAAERGYVRPEFCAQSVVEIHDGRHPVIEVLRGSGFVPNDVHLAADADRFLLITGPNMGGKSTYLRQTALLVIMAQIGSYVPARAMRLGIVDRIFTRIGAGDDLASGQSTFYLEMAETANILERCTSRSLVLIDEVGRGTGTSDGLSIAQAICEYLLGLAHGAPMTLFATHFHELVHLADHWPLVSNFHVTAIEDLGRGGEPVFSHRVLPGFTSRSFGIEVAKMAGLPESVVGASTRASRGALRRRRTCEA